MNLADAEGITALTMRRLAEKLGVKPMTLYHHVTNKDEVLDGMVDAVFSEIELPPENAEWKPAMRHRVQSARAVLLRHPVGGQLDGDTDRTRSSNLGPPQRCDRLLSQSRLHDPDDRSRLLARR